METFLRPFTGYFDCLKNNLVKGLSSLKEINTNNSLIYYKKISIFLLTVHLTGGVLAFQAQAYSSSGKSGNGFGETIATIILGTICMSVIIILKEESRNKSREEDEANFLSKIILALKNNNTTAAYAIISETKEIAVRRYSFHYVPGVHCPGKLAPPVEDILKEKILTNAEKIEYLEQIADKGVHFLGQGYGKEICEIYQRIIDSKMEYLLTQLISALEKDDNKAIERLIEEMKLIARSIDIFHGLGRFFYGKLAPPFEELLRSERLSNIEKGKFLKMISDKKIKFMGVPNPLRGWTKIRKICNLEAWEQGDGDC